LPPIAIYPPRTQPMVTTNPIIIFMPSFQVKFAYP
jgi:hypothetical protein